MSRRSRSTPPPARRRGGAARVARDLEAIALRIRQISALAGVLAAGQEDPLSHALHLIEESLLEAEGRLERLYQPRRGLLKRPRTSTRRSKPSPEA